jgi:hypothetical protein
LIIKLAISVTNSNMCSYWMPFGDSKFMESI